MLLEILTGVLVVITGFYAWATFRILKANEGVVAVAQKQVDAMVVQHEATIRPYVYASPVMYAEDPKFFLKVANAGKSVAENLQLTMDPPYHRGSTGNLKNIAEFPAFSRPIPAFPPGAEILFSLDAYFVVLGDDTDRELKPSRFKITASYASGERQYSESAEIDYFAFFNTNPPQDPVVRQLKAIAHNLENKP